MATSENMLKNYARIEKIKRIVKWSRSPARSYSNVFTESLTVLATTVLATIAASAAYSKVATTFWEG